MKRLIDFSLTTTNEKEAYMITNSVVLDDGEDRKEQREVLVVFEGDRDEECGEGRRLRGKGRKEVHDQAEEMEADLTDKKYPTAVGSITSDISKTKLFLIFVLVLLILFSVILSLPEIASVEGGSEFEWSPRSVQDFIKDKNLLLRYRDAYSGRLLIGIMVIYIISQTFCIPSSGTVLNLLVGYIYSEVTQNGEYVVALPVAIFCASSGAVMTYLLSYFTCRGLVMRTFPKRVQWLRQRVAELQPLAAISFFTSMRVSPVIPAYLLNLAAPLTPLPLWQFWLATVFGCTPHSLVTVTAGATISRMKPGENIFKTSFMQIVWLLLLAVAVALIPFLLRVRAPA